MKTRAIPARWTHGRNTYSTVQRLQQLINRPTSSSFSASPSLVYTTSAMKARFNPLFLLPLLPGALAWGSLGHMTVGIIAQSFLTPSAEKWAQSLLGSTNSTYLASVAPWADFYRTTKAGAFSEPFHFIDAQDNPPTSCNLQFNRDCGNTGCLVSAITNYVCPFLVRPQQRPL